MLRSNTPAKLPLSDELWRSHLSNRHGYTMLSTYSYPRAVRLAILASLCFASSTWGAESATTSEFESLFDGESLKGWTTADGKPVTKGWQVVDGMLVRNARGGSIYTEKEYGDFELRFEWKIARRGNSGIKYRMAHYDKGVYGRPGWLGYEYQIWDDARETSDDTSAASIYLLQAPAKDKKVKPAGEFNTARIVAVGTHLEHWLNGEKVLDVETDTDDWLKRIEKTKFGPIEDIFQNPKGRIMIQDHGNKVWFRNIEIRQIENGGESE